MLKIHNAWGAEVTHVEFILKRLIKTNRQHSFSNGSGKSSTKSTGIKPLTAAKQLTDDNSNGSNAEGDELMLEAAINSTIKTPLIEKPPRTRTTSNTQRRVKRSNSKLVKKLAELEKMEADFSDSDSNIVNFQDNIQGWLYLFETIYFLIK